MRLMAVAILAMGCWECTNDTQALDVAGSSYPISFSTKVGLVESGDLESFTVYAHTLSEEPTSVMEQVEVSYDSESDAWSYGTTASVSAGVTAQFYAYASADDGLTTTFEPEDGRLSLKYNFTPDEDDKVKSENQTDMLYATTQSNALTPVSMEFQHAFAAVAFNATGDMANYITDISLSNIFDGGTLYISAEDGAQWNDQTLSSSSVQFEAETNDMSSITSDADYATQVHELTDIDNGGYIIVIPQTLYKSTQVNITLTYADGVTDVKTLYINNTEQWEAGMCYTYTVQVESSGYVTLDSDVYILSWDYISVSGSLSNVDYAYINLDDYVDSDGTTRLSSFQNKIAQYNEAGITRYVVTGTYFEGALGSFEEYNEELLSLSNGIDVTTLKIEDAYSNENNTVVDGNQGLTYVDQAINYLFENMTDININSPFATFAPNIRMLDLSGVKGLELFPFIFYAGLEYVYDDDGYETSTNTLIYKELNTIVLPDYITEIPAMAFLGLEALKSVNLENITGIATMSFYNCVYLKNLDLSKLEYLGLGSFNGCISLTTLSAPNLTEMCALICNGFDINSGDNSYSLSSLISLSLPQYTPAEGFLNSIPYSSLTYLDLSSEADFSDDIYYNTEDLEAINTSYFSNTHLILHQNKSAAASGSPKVENSIYWAGYQWGRISYITDDGDMLDGIINLDDYDNVETLRSEVTRRVELGVSNFDVSGRYFEGCFGTGGGSSEEGYTIEVSSPFFFSDKDDCTSPHRILTFDISDVTGFDNDELFPGIFSQGYDINEFYSEESSTDTTTNDVIYTTEYVLPSTITEIPEAAFFGNKYLSTVNVLEVKQMGDYAFMFCLNLTSINVPLLERVPMLGFLYCSSLRDVYLPIIKEIELMAFTDCTSLSTFSFSNVETIGDNAFENTSLNSIYCPKLTEVGTSTFQNIQGSNGNGVTVRIPVATKIGEMAFYGTDILSISASNVKTLDISCFEDITRITSMELESVTTVGSRAFANTSLETLTLPSVTTIEGAFSGSTDLTSLNLTSLNDKTVYDTSFLGITSENIALRLYGGHSNTEWEANATFEKSPVATSDTQWGGNTWKSITYTDGYTDIDKALNLSYFNATSLYIACDLRVAMGQTSITYTGVYTYGTWGEDDILANANEEGYYQYLSECWASRADRLFRFNEIHFLNVTDLMLYEYMFQGVYFENLTINNYSGEGVTLPSFHGDVGGTASFQSNCVNNLTFTAAGDDSYTVWPTYLELTTKSDIAIDITTFTLPYSEYVNEQEGEVFSRDDYDDYYYDYETGLVVYQFSEYCYNMCDLVLHSSKYDAASDGGKDVETSNGTEWKGVTWKSISFVDDNGVVVTFD